MKKIEAIILAAGRGTRMKSDLPKVLAKLHSRPLLSFVTKALDAAGVKKKIAVVGYKDDLIRKAFPELRFVNQNRLLGSGDAVKRVKNALSDLRGDVLVLYGDTPFISTETIKELVKTHRASRSSCTLLTARMKDATGYGRVAKNENGYVVRVIEEQDAKDFEKAIDEINVGCYCFNKKDLFSSLGKLKMNRKKREYFLTDIIEILAKKGKTISSLACKDSREAMGINSRVDLACADNIVKTRVLEYFMKNGVTVVDKATTFIDMDARIGPDTTILPNTVIEKSVSIGSHCKIGPFARLRPGTAIDSDVEIGNFVELARTKVLKGTKIKHHTYLGDAIVGKNVNIGAGTITANYDGKNKNRTFIEDNAFIGVGAVLIAPVRIGRGATVGAGCVVPANKDVPPKKTVVGVPAAILERRRKPRR